jgi:hypothetical protein
VAHAATLLSLVRGRSARMPRISEIDCGTALRCEAPVVRRRLSLIAYRQTRSFFSER